MKSLFSHWLMRVIFFSCLGFPSIAFAAAFEGSQLTAIWGIPFAGILLCIALMPLLTPHFWHHHYGKVVAAWSLAFFIPFAVLFGADVAGQRKESYSS